jgi:drug/metabolite transporter (DMT)-like permease
MRPNLYALCAIGLWATLASFSVTLSDVPPFLLTGLGLLIGSVVSLPLTRFNLARWRVPPRTLALGVYGLFGYHLALFVALRHAPPVEANLVNYLWPLLVVVLAPVILPDLEFRGAHLATAMVGFMGAALAIAGGEQLGGLEWGYVPALGAAIIWSTYSLLTRRMPPFPSAAVGGFCAVAGSLSLLCSLFLEPAVSINLRDWALITLMGVGPLGIAFYFWDRAIKGGDPRTIGILSFITPLASTGILLVVRQQQPTIWIGAATVLIIGAALRATRLS